MFKVEGVASDAVGVDGEPLKLGGDDKVMLTCLGIGYTNISKRTA